jgi:hypothetical protein
LNDSFFAGDDRGFLKEGIMTRLMAPMWPLNSQTSLFVFTYIVYEGNRESFSPIEDGTRTGTKPGLEADENIA